MICDACRGPMISVNEILGDYITPDGPVEYVCNECFDLMYDLGIIKVCASCGKAWRNNWVVDDKCPRCRR